MAVNFAMTTNYVSEPTKDGRRYWQYEAKSPGGAPWAGISHVLGSDAPSTGKWLRITKVSVGYMGTSGVEVTPIVYYNRATDGVYLPTKVTQLARITTTGSITESTLVWSDVSVVMPIDNRSAADYILSIYCMGETVLTDEHWVHISGEVW